MTTVRFWVEGNAVGLNVYEDEIEIEDIALDGLTPEEREEQIASWVSDAVTNVVQWGWEEVPGE